MVSDLPFIDEFDITVEAPAAIVFEATARNMGRSFEGPLARIFFGLLGCVHRGTSYTVPPVEGQEASGFRVAVANQPEKLVLEGQHRFATYRLSFFVGPLAAGRSRLRARTDALFPGIKGAVYRALVIRSGGHEIVVKRMLSAISRRSERLQIAK